MEETVGEEKEREAKKERVEERKEERPTFHILAVTAIKTLDFYNFNSLKMFL